MNLESINLCLSANQGHHTYAATTVASECRRTGRWVHRWVNVRDGDLPEAFQAGILTLEFARLRRPLKELPAGVHSCVEDRMVLVEDATDFPRSRERNAKCFASGNLHHSALL
jgi:hypothetical protein